MTNLNTQEELAASIRASEQLERMQRAEHRQIEAIVDAFEAQRRTFKRVPGSLSAYPFVPARFS